MKISKIEIKDFHQFKDLTIDLTYPKGHAKEGQPLSKVCFIGQSGTGKTSILELIPKFLYNYDTQLIEKSNYDLNLENIEITVVFGNKNEYESKIRFNSHKGNREYLSGWEWGENKHANEEVNYEIVADFLDNKWINGTSTKPIYFPANLNFDMEIKMGDSLIDTEIIDFSTQKVALVWNLILEKVKKYQEKELQIRQELSKIVEQYSDNLDIIRTELKKLEDWKEREFNPIKDIADHCLDELLLPFKLKVKTELDIKIKDDIGFIKLVDVAKKEIPDSLWSTGTKQVVLSAMPLYLLKPNHTIILFDEPERSLYPDMQRFIVEYYSSFTKKCQFIYATHSPIIASNFEPWEIVELKFNEAGKIYRELYYDGENHINNYKWNPRYMRWDDILQRIFDMESDGSPARKQKLDELAMNNVKFKKLKQAGKEDSDEAKSILKNISHLSKDLSQWDLKNYAKD